MISFPPSAFQQQQQLQSQQFPLHLSASQYAPQQPQMNHQQQFPVAAGFPPQFHHIHGQNNSQNQGNGFLPQTPGGGFGGASFQGAFGAAAMPPTVPILTMPAIPPAQMQQNQGGARTAPTGAAVPPQRLPQQFAAVQQKPPVSTTSEQQQQNGVAGVSAALLHGVPYIMPPPRHQQNHQQQHSNQHSGPGTGHQTPAQNQQNCLPAAFQNYGQIQNNHQTKVVQSQNPPPPGFHPLNNNNVNGANSNSMDYFQTQQQQQSQSQVFQPQQPQQTQQQQMVMQYPDQQQFGIWQENDTSNTTTVYQQNQSQNNNVDEIGAQLQQMAAFGGPQQDQQQQMFYQQQMGMMMPPMQQQMVVDPTQGAFQPLNAYANANTVLVPAAIIPAPIPGVVPPVVGGDQQVPQQQMPPQNGENAGDQKQNQNQSGNQQQQQQSPQQPPIGVAMANKVLAEGSRRTSYDNDVPAIAMMNGGPCMHCARLSRAGSVAGSSKSAGNSVTNSPILPKCLPKVPENQMTSQQQQQSANVGGSQEKDQGAGNNKTGSPQKYPQNSESPSSQMMIMPGSDDESVDSGRETGGPLTSYSPFGDAEHQLTNAGGDMPAMYEFELPNTLVGLIIGIGGKTIKELCVRAEVRMLIRPHHTVTKFNTHQICSIQGRRECINKCLHMIRYRFPPCRFPELNLKPVIPPPVMPPQTLVGGQPTALSLPVGVPCEAYISAPIDAGHFFLQLPTHPSFPSLTILDQYMLGVYSQPAGAPELPKPCNVGVLCAAPAYNGWFRAITLAYEEEMDETLVRYVDYGGFAKIPRADLRQIRTDFISLPLQAIECYLANVQPADGQNWCDAANELFQQMAVGRIVQAELVGYNQIDGIPVVELFVLDDQNQTVRFDKLLLDRGLARASDPSPVVRLPKFTVTGPQQTEQAIHSFAAAAATSAFGSAADQKRGSSEGGNNNNIKLLRDEEFPALSAAASVSAAGAGGRSSV